MSSAASDSSTVKVFIVEHRGKFGLRNNATGEYHVNGVWAKVSKLLGCTSRDKGCVQLTADLNGFEVLGTTSPRDGKKRNRRF